MKWYACWCYIYQHKHPVHDYFLPALSTPFLFTSIYQITSFHFHLFPFLLLFQVLKQCSHFNVNSGYADVSLIPPLSFRATFTQNPWERAGEKEKITETHICLWSCSATQYVLCNLVKGNQFFLMGHTHFPFSAVGERCISIWYYIDDVLKKLTVLHLLCRVLRVTQTVQKPCTITHFLSVRLPLCIPPHASMKSTFILLWKSVSTRCRASSSLGGGAGKSVHSWTFFFTKRACVHTFEPTRWSHLLVYCQYQMAQGL